MKRIGLLTAVAAAACLSPQAAQAQAGDYVIDSTTPASVFELFLGAGSWSVGVTAGAWNPWGFTAGCNALGGSCSNGWITTFHYALDGGAPTGYGDSSSRWATADLAFENRFEPIFFNVVDPSTLQLTLSIEDNPYTDNVGNLTVSVRRLPVEAVPEPAALLLLGSGLIGIAGVGLRRREDADLG